MDGKMKVLWLSNIIFPEVSQAIGMPKVAIGSWLMAYKAVLDEHYPQHLDLHIISPYEGGTFMNVKVGGACYYLYPEKNTPNRLRKWLDEICKTIDPDVVHLHGSEFPHSSMLFNAANPRKPVLSVQGLVSVCASYYYAGLELDKKATLRDLLKHDTPRNQRDGFARRGIAEVELIKKLHHAIGRTSWDHAHCQAINPSLKYYKCNEPMRGSFYQARWDIARCNRHTIFACHSSSPLKGLHKLLEALPLVRRHFPDVQLFLPGANLAERPWYKARAYWKIIKRLIEKHQLQGTVHFLGNLDEQQMVAQLLSANAFVCPSAIENSSNSVCEAQLAGLPVVASYVGGMMDLVDDGTTGFLYRFEETEMLAEKLCRIFADDKLAAAISQNEREAAAIRHDRKAIAAALWEIYNEISNS